MPGSGVQAMPACVQCGQSFEQQGRGRPRVRCMSCSPARKRDYAPRPRLSKACGECGEQFEGSAAAKFCSPRCRDRASEARRRVPCSSCGVLIARPSRTSAVDPMCRPCRRPLPEHGELARYEKHKCRCNECRAAKRKAQREYAARRKAEGRPIRVRRVTVSRECAWCGESFQARADYLAGGRGRFCSNRCVGMSQRGDDYDESRPKWTATPALRRRIIERDGGVCQLCEQPVRPDVDVNHPRYPNLDHIVPRSRGGADDESNLRLACRQCNVLRGADVEWVPLKVVA